MIFLGYIVTIKLETHVTHNSTYTLLASISAKFIMPITQHNLTVLTTNYVAIVASIVPWVCGKVHHARDKFVLMCPSRHRYERHSFHFLPHLNCHP